MPGIFLGKRPVLSGPPPALFTLADLPVGEIVKFKINSAYHHLILVHHGRPGSWYDSGFDNAAVLLLKNIYEKRSWGVSGNNSYADSTIHPYLNAAFKNLIDEPVRNRLVQVRIPYRPGTGTSTTINSGANGLLTQIFLPSMAEMGHVITSLMIEDGQKFDYFIYGDSAEANNQRIAYDANNTAVIQWSRSPYKSTSPIHVSQTVADGRAARNSADQVQGIRPVMVLPDNTAVSSVPGADGAYEILP